MSELTAAELAKGYDELASPALRIGPVAFLMKAKAETTVLSLTQRESSDICNWSQYAGFSLEISATARHK
jgi:hypothetical protein